MVFYGNEICYVIPFILLIICIVKALFDLAAVAASPFHLADRIMAACLRGRAAPHPLNPTFPARITRKCADSLFAEQ